MTGRDETGQTARRLLEPDDPRHGTYNGYHNYRCRCRPCTQAHTDYIRARNHRLGIHRPREDYLYLHTRNAELRDNHGTESRYRLGCRCSSCTAAAADVRRIRRLTPNPKAHGANAYKNGCRCDTCRQAHTASHREYRARKRQAA